MKKNKNIENPDQAFYLSDITKGLKAKQEEYKNRDKNADDNNFVNVEEKIAGIRALIKRNKPK